MIKAYIGRVREGKTLSMVADVLPIMREAYKHNYKIYSNTPFHTKAKEFYSLKDFFKYKNFTKSVPLEPIFLNDPEIFFDKFCNEKYALFCMDEGAIVMSDYAWNTIDNKIYNRLHEHAKAHVHLLYTSQYFDGVAAKLRKLTNEVIWCSSVIRNPFYKHPIYDPFNLKPPVMIRQIVYDKNFFDNNGKPNAFEYEKEKLYIIEHRYLYGSKLKEAMNSFDTEFFVKRNYGK